MPFSLGYLSMEGMIKACGGNEFCMACYDGNYPVPFEEPMLKNALEK